MISLSRSIDSNPVGRCQADEFAPWKKVLAYIGTKL